MSKTKPKPFVPKIDIIGINPFVFVPEVYLNYLFVQAKKEKGKSSFVKLVECPRDAMQK